MNTLNILYIDDTPEASLGRYLARQYRNEQHNIHYSEITFEHGKNYDDLLGDSKVRAANIILIDSRLFENHSAAEGKFTGEEFKFVLKKFFPYIEVIVITQNRIEEDFDMIPKYDSEHYSSSKEYYDKFLSPALNNAIRSLEQYWLLANKMHSNDAWEKLLKERVLGTLNGMSEYESLTKADIDVLVSAFKELQEKVDA